MKNNLGAQLKNAVNSTPVRRLSDIIAAPLTILSSVWFRYFRARGSHEMPVTNKILQRVGIFPIADHYYEPLFNASKYLRHPLNQARHLPGIELNVNEQLELVQEFDYFVELENFPKEKVKDLSFFHNNGSYMHGDAEYLYSLIRKKKPKRLIEVGCGFSTLVIEEAIKKTKEEEEDYHCHHICIEPFEMPWLEALDIDVIRSKVEDISLDVFDQLKENDIFFIDSSHIIRPQGDVLFQYLQVLPKLNKGVLVHIHDIFTPYDYLDSWIRKMNRFWNEQYLLEAFLTMNKQYKVIASMNYLHHTHYDILAKKFPILAAHPDGEPCAFWIQRV